MDTPHTIGHRAYQAGAKDAHGNPVDTWAAPVTVNVYAIYPRYAQEPEPDRPLVVVGLAVLAPPTVQIGPRDRVVIDGEEWDVEGDPGDWTRGPWDYAPGVEIVLKRAEG